MAGTRLTRETRALLVCAAVLFVCIEGVARFGLERVSSLIQRLKSEAYLASFSK